MTKCPMKRDLNESINQSVRRPNNLHTRALMNSGGLLANTRAGRWGWPVVDRTVSTTRAAVAVLIIIITVSWFPGTWTRAK